MHAQSSTRIARLISAWDRQDDLILKRQQKIMRDIDKEEKAQKKREVAYKEDKKKRLDASKKKETEIMNARASVS